MSLHNKRGRNIIPVVGSRRPGRGKPCSRTGHRALHPALHPGLGSSPPSEPSGQGSGGRGLTVPRGKAAVFRGRGAAHFTLLAGNRGILELSGQEGPSGTWRPAFHPCSRSSCPQGGLGRRIILNLATPLEPHRTMRFLHRTRTPPVAIVSEEEGFRVGKRTSRR